MPNLKHPLMFIIFSLVLFSAKTYFVTTHDFSLSFENEWQKYILMMTPLITGLVWLFLSLLMTDFKQRLVFTIGLALSSFVLYTNVVYYRFFSDFITLPVLFQTKNFGDLGGSALSLMNGLHDVLYFSDTILLFLYCFWTKKHIVKLNRKYATMTTLLCLGVLSFLNLSFAEKERPQLLTRTFDREMLVRFLGVYNYHIYDSVLYFTSNAQRALADSDELTDIKTFTSGRNTLSNDTYFGSAKGKNVILISLESTQTFAMDYTLNGEEVMPFLNQLKKDSFYFPNFYHQTEQGKTSDSEFLVDNSLYPLPRGAVFTLKAQNEYNAFPEIIKKTGYKSYAFHGNNASFWNRDMMYKSLGYTKYFDEKSYHITKENSVNYGLKDIPFFQQSIPILETLPQPFYAKFITLTNHYPYQLHDDDATIDPHTTGDGSVDRYFQTLHYMDEAVSQFFNAMKEKGLYENSIFILYGDHYGISENHDKAMEKVIGKEITPYETVQLQKVPLMIHIPGEQGKEFQTVGGQIDLKPTLLHLLGIQNNDDISFGVDLLAPHRDELTILRNGRFITDTVIYTNETCYNSNDGKQISKSYCKAYLPLVEKELSLSDKTVYGDLLRFHHSN